MSQKLDRSVYHPDRIQGNNKSGVGDNLERTLHLSTLDTEKTNSRKRINKNGNLSTISDSDDIETIEEDENADIRCSVDDKNQQIDTKKDMKKTDLEASFDCSSDLDRTPNWSILNTEKTNFRKKRNNYKNGNLQTISDSDEIETTEEIENADIKCSVDNINQQIDTKKDIKKTDLEASFDCSSDFDRTLNVSILNTEKSNFRKMRNNYKNGNLQTISDSDEIETTEENENADIKCSVDNKNQQIDTKKDIKKTDLEASFDCSTDCVLLPTHSATDSSSTPNNKRNAMFLTFIGAGIMAAMYVLNKLK